MVDLPLATSSDDPLAQPTRAQLFELLGELDGPVGTAELARRLDLHPNGVRVHLERLEGQGLVRRVRIRQPRGRPRDAWAVAPDARPGGRPPRAYADLVRWLARAIGDRPSTLSRVERTGTEIGRELAPPDGSVADGTLEATLARLGFEPRADARRGDRLTLSLCNCPYRDAVRENQEVVCTLHRGITRGMLEVLDPGARLDAFSPRDPDEAGCRIELSGVPPGEHAEKH